MARRHPCGRRTQTKVGKTPEIPNPSAKNKTHTDNFVPVWDMNGLCLKAAATGAAVGCFVTVRAPHRPARQMRFLRRMMESTT